MTRLTRAETQARTRDQLVRVGADLFLREGFGRTSLERVASEAGLSKGAVYSNFATKGDLGLAVLDHVRAVREATMRAALGSRASLESVVAGFARWAESNIGDEEWTAFEVEFAAGARLDIALREQLVRRRRVIVAGVTALLEEQLAGLGLTVPMPFDVAAELLLSLGIGLGVQRAIDPQLPLTPMLDLVLTLVGSGVATA